MTNLNTLSNTMTRVNTQDDICNEMDVLYDMYATGVNAELFDYLTMLQSKELETFEDGNIFHKIMADFIVDYRNQYAKLN